MAARSAIASCSAAAACGIPVVETVNRMDVSLISVPIAVQGAYSEGGIPLNVHAIANIKVSTDRRFVGNAIERFLGKDRTEIARVVKETLEGHLRGVLATMTPEELNEDRLKFSKHLELSAGPDLEKLGLELDVLKIQHVADDGNYLESIGRQRIAEILRTAEVAESDATREAEQAEAACPRTRRGRDDERAGRGAAQAERAPPDQGGGRCRGERRAQPRRSGGPASARRGRARACRKFAAISRRCACRPRSRFPPRSTRRCASCSPPVQAATDRRRR